ncbi:MAG: GGDEF domain-containing phosphodiesterase [Saccharofermentans sp.]|nr:GGDEF domain-containing phosphodiesterase [Saccharofermentans sp.]
MNNNAVNDEFRLFKQSPLSIAVFQVENDVPVIKVVSKGLAKLVGENKTQDEVMEDLAKNPFAFVHDDDLDMVKAASAAFTNDDAPYDLVFKTKVFGFGVERNVHGVGYHDFNESGDRVAVFTYEEITPFIRKEREQAAKLERTIQNIISTDDYAIAIIEEETHELLLYNDAMEAIIPPANFYTSGMTFEEYFYGSQSKRNNIFEVLADKGEKLYVDPYTDAEIAVRVSKTSWNGRKALYVKGSTTSEAYYDGLTQLPNKRFFQERTEVLYRQQQAQGMTPYIAYMNVRALHYYNNAFGYEDGNRLLIGIAMVLKKYFPNQLVARFAADHFFILTNERPDDGIFREAAEEIRDLGQMAVEVKFGFVEIPTDVPDLTEIIDYAKTACESIKKSLDQVSVEYSESMNEDNINKKYVIENIDRAVARGYIKVYYQPVVRTLTGKVCGAEALARWVDPRKGILNVGTVISALEESHQIHKLDCCIIEQVCKEYRECVDDGKVPVPVSVNLSRLDFVCCDIFSSIERSRRKYSVPRNMINLEITESVFGSESSVRSTVTRFRDAGYQVWMDDFGSGYSSLNLLKEFSFDELKLDMAFLTNFSDKGRSIIKSTIDMAKNIGVYTLAEGVETEEQYEFLKKIGCEKVQGFLFERPLPYEQFIESCEKKNLEIEEPIWKEYYDEIGKSRFLSDKPVALVECEKDNLKMLFANHLFYDYKKRVGQNSIEDINENLNDEFSSLNRAIRNYIVNTEDFGETFNLTLLENDSYVGMSCKCITRCAGRYVFYISIESVSDNEVGDTNKNTDNVIRNLYYLFDRVTLLDLDSDSGEEIFINKAFTVSNHEVISNYSESVGDLGAKRVHADDYERFIKYTNTRTIKSRMEAAGKDMLSEYFRILNSDGEYVWKLLTYIKMIDKNQNQVIACIREVPNNNFN